MSQHLGHMFLRSVIVLSLSLILLPCVTNFVFLAVAQLPDVHILDLIHKARVNYVDTSTPYKHGFNASLWSRNFMLVGRRVHMTPVTANVDTMAFNINDAVERMPDLSLVLGPTSAELILAALPALRNNSLVSFGPLTEVSAAHIWDPHLYFLLMSTKLSTYTLLRHAVINLRVRRIGFMYTAVVGLGFPEYEYTVKLLHGMGRKLCGVFRLDGRVAHKANDELFKKEWEAFAETRPQAVIIMGFSNSTTIPFVGQMMKDTRTNSAYLMAPAMSEGLVLRVWEEAKAKGAPSFPGQVIISSSYPAPTDTSSDMIKTYRTVMVDYLEKSGQTLYKAAEGIPDGRNGGAAMLAGWVAGEVLSQAISQFNPSLGQEEFIASLFNQRTYVIKDVIIGTFGGDISKEFAEAGAVARCNQGATTAYVKKFLNATTSEAVLEGDFSLQLQNCQADNLALFDSSAIVTVNATDMGPVGVYVTNGVIVGLNAGASFGTTVAKHDMTVKVLQSPNNDITSVVQNEKDSHWTNIVTGSVLDSTMDIPNITFIDPISSTVLLNKFRRNVIFLSPTVEQQLFVLVEYVSSLPGSTVHAVIRSKSPQAALDVLKKSLLTFGVELTSYALLKHSDKIENSLWSSGFTIMIEVDEPDIPVFVKHLEQNSNARVVVLFTAFIAFYDMFCAAFKGTAAADRLIVITNMPHWADVNSPLTLIRNYHKSITDPSAWSPLSLQNFIAGRILRNAMDGLPVVNWLSVIRYFYSSIVVSLDDMSFGPFADNSSVTCASKSKRDSLACAKNFGATSISVWPMSRVFDPSVPTLFGPVSPSMVYRDTSTGLTRDELIGVVGGAIEGVLVLIAVLVMLFCCFLTDNFNAPKDTEDPVTLVFTDIQGSTTLWATCPEIMPEAVATHHRLIRWLIVKYKCYEVKTIGDSFMIACKSASAAVKLVGDLQRTFLQHDWGTSAMDQAYHKFEERQAAEDADYEPPTARLDAAVYRKYWSGLRVRAGVHTGLSDIRHDEVTKRYDYYGSTSNTAARTESVAHGGQVLLTGAAYMALSTAERAGLDVTALGPVELRGVPQPMEMYQLNAVPGRAFAKLRLGREQWVNSEEFCDQSSETSSHPDDDSTSDPVVFLLGVLFKRLKPKMRLKLLQPLCDCWAIGDPRRHAAYSDDKLCNALISQLAQRVTGVAEKERCNWSEVLVNAHKSLHSASHLDITTECLTDASSIEVQCLNPWILDASWEEQNA